MGKPVARGNHPPVSVLPQAKVGPLGGDDAALSVLSEGYVRHGVGAAGKVVEREAAFGGNNLSQMRQAAHPEVTVAGKQEMQPLFLGKIERRAEVGGFAVREAAQVRVAAVPEFPSWRVEHAPDGCAVEVHGFGGPQAGFYMPQEKCAVAVGDHHLIGRICGERRADSEGELVVGKRCMDLIELAVRGLKVDAGGCADPQGSIGADKDAANGVRMEPAGRAILLELASIVAVEAIFGSHPEVAQGVLRNAVDVGVAEALGGLAEAVLLG